MSVQLRLRVSLEIDYVPQTFRHDTVVIRGGEGTVVIGYEVIRSGEGTVVIRSGEGTVVIRSGEGTVVIRSGEGTVIIGYSGHQEW